MALLGAAPVLGLLGSILMLYAGKWLWPSVYFASGLALLLPHPRFMCRHCIQREQGPCPIGRVLVQAETR